MTFQQLAQKRRSIRKFEEKRVPRHIIDSLIATTLTAPSSKNCRSTRIAYTENPDILRLVAGMRSTGSQFVQEAPLAFFILAEDSGTDLWKENCSISATILQLAAEDLGLGTCWVHVDGRPHRNEDPDGKTAAQYLQESVPQISGYRILCVVACGYPAIYPSPHKPRPEDAEMAFRIE
ncbi:MAG: nitroreductase family protein [Rikenellaceae bacterium]|nr:nitroreductase family protein [Rikenellaceae bacterium]